MQCPTKKSLSISFGISFFFKYIQYFTLIAKKKEKKTHILNEFSTKNLNFQMALDFQTIQVAFKRDLIPKKQLIFSIISSSLVSEITWSSSC